MENEGSKPSHPLRQTPVDQAQKNPAQPPPFNFSETLQQRTTGSESFRTTRRFIAEDLTHNPDVVPSLADLVIKQIIENFSCELSN